MNKSGWLNINKPINYNSTKIVSIIKRNIKAKKVGHGGTLDPFASGVLPICINEATKTVEYIMDHDKTYLFHLTFGIETDTYDIEGEIINKNDKIPTEKEILQTLPTFIGKIKQIPPKYSALKINGQRACDIMRAGGEVIIKEREIEIFDIKYNGFVNENTIELEVDCGRGTYIRSLGVDLAKKLNCIAFISKLERKRVGDFKIGNSINLNEIENINLEDYLINMNNILDLPIIICNDFEINKLKNGIGIEKQVEKNVVFKVLNDKNELFCLGQIIKDKFKSIKWLNNIC